MIEFKVFFHDQTITGFVASGHSGFGLKGSDIICSAVSALSQTAILALGKIAGVEPQWKRHEGHLECRLPQGLDPEQRADCQLVLKTILTGIENIADEYPDYIRIGFEEV